VMNRFARNMLARASMFRAKRFITSVEIRLR